MLISGRRLISSSAATSKFRFYDLIKQSNRSPSHNSSPVSLLEKQSKVTSREKEKETQMQKVRKAHTKSEPDTSDESEAKIKAAEAKIAKVFGGRIKGEDRKSSSRINVGKPRIIAGIKVPDKPTEPDNCCMSGCINCVWEIYNDDVKDWNAQRKKAAAQMVSKGGVWPEDFHPPVELLKPQNLPASLAHKSTHTPADQEEAWDNVPVQIRVFAEMEKKIKSKKKKPQST
ncbi:hypothetical protein JCM33374_g6211 [Metschnikowia sp. JCM 33374]|nr:hypothetical protein JCM33374_g6211 [Metschnikowia sp. JCM 33374]